MIKKTLKQEIEEIARDEIANGRFDGSLHVEEFDEKPCFRAEIDSQKLKDISLMFNPEYDKEKPGKIKVAARDITRHEIDHKRYHGFNGCPRTSDNHAELIFEPMAEILFQKGYNHNDVHYVVNTLEDTILQRDLRKEFALDGQICFWEDIGRHNKYSDFYKAYTKLNLFLWGNKKQKKELQKYTNIKESKSNVNEVLNNFLKRTGISELKQKIVVNGKETKVRDRDAVMRFLNNERNWQKISRIYAEEFSKLMQPGYALPIFNHSGRGTKGRDVKTPSASGAPQEGNPFDMEMYTPQFKKQRIQKAYAGNQSKPVWMDSFEALDMLYQSLAQKLNIKVESYTKQTSMPIFHYGKRAFDPEKDNFKHIGFGFDDKGKIELKKKRWHEDMPLEYKINPKGFPELRFCLLDTSGSMREDPNGASNIGKTSIIPWGDNSKYHYALLGWYGLLEYLKQNHLLKQMNISLGNFGDETYIKEGLMEAKKLALNPQLNSSRTNIDLDEVKKMFRSHGMLVFTISDGEIHNWSSIKDEFIKNAKQHYYFHLQIGGSNKFTNDLKKANLYVENIKNAQDLAKKVIDLTDKLYRG